MNLPSLHSDTLPAATADRRWILSRRKFLATSALAGGGLLLGRSAAFAAERQKAAATADKALIAITLDLEMSRNFPTWETTHWDYEKGVLNEETKRYAVEAARRVKARGGVIHFFCVGRVLEHENVDWLKEIVQTGHPVGNHTYDHINVLATKPEDLQFRFKRAPWLIAGKAPADVIRENIRTTNIAFKNRIGVEPAGFRTPGGFATGLHDRADLQQMLLDLGYKWVSSLSPGGLKVEQGKAPTPELYDAIVKTQVETQPFIYPTGLIEVPMSAISDVGAFRNGRWKLDHFLKAVRLGVEWAIENRGVFDLLTHPSVLYPSDPEFKVFNLVCDLVEKAGDRAMIADIGTLAARAKQTKRA
jgi:peptidoglycan/xylan/chitin deacetylase (PgdA/CDA1 family)